MLNSVKRSPSNNQHLLFHRTETQKFYHKQYHRYLRKENILGKLIKGSPNGISHTWYIWSDLWRKSGKILEKWFPSLGRGSKMKHFPLKFWHLKISFLLFSKITIFAKFSKNHVLSSLAHLSRRLKGELIVYQSSRRLCVCVSVNIFKLEYLGNQWANSIEILSEPSLGWGKGCIRFWARSDRNAGVHGNG